jgi:hypothetical protein
MLVALLLAVGIGAGLQLTFLLSRAQRLSDDQRALQTQLVQFQSHLADLASAQAAYVAPGQPDAPWLDRASALLAQLQEDLTAIRAKTQTSESAPAIQAASEAISSLAAADSNARGNLAQEQDLIAADIVFGEARDAIGAARSTAGQISTFESAAFEAARAANQRQLVLVSGAAAAIWLIGLLLLTPRARMVSDAATGLSEITRVSRDEGAEPANNQVSPTPVRSAVDLVAAAELCTALSRVAASAALPDMLARTAALVDATGIIVWLGNRDELHAVMSHGYNPRVIRQLGSIARSADNATAEAWRTGELRTVPGDMMSNGAIVAPMFGVDSCVGVLAAEVRHGREQDLDTQAVTMMVAAQLATIVGAWPTAADARAAEA